jgi:initiation factor 1A
MVRNVQGGTGTKSLARKHQNSSTNRLRLSEDEAEVYGFIGKIYGNGMCQIFTNDNEELLGHIRGKMRGHHKRHNLVTATSVVLVGLREWESGKSDKKRNCDIITIYSDNEVEQLREIPSIQIDVILQKRLSSFQSKEDAALAFDYTEDVDDGGDGGGKIEPLESFALAKENEISIDDI